MSQDAGLNPSAPWLPMPTDLSLSPDHVHVWQNPTEISPTTLAHFSTLLTSDEQKGFDRYRIPAKRTEAIVARGLLRHILGHLQQLHPHQLTLTSGPHGKPHLDQTFQNQSVGFNVSHTRNKVLIAVALARDIGIDVEYLRPNIAYADLAHRFFTSRESAAILALPLSDQRAAFFTAWTRKESLLKATGHGISAGLDSFEVNVHPSDPPKIIATRDPTHAAQWSLYDIQLGPNYKAALAINGAPATIHHWTMNDFKRMPT